MSLELYSIIGLLSDIIRFRGKIKNFSQELIRIVPVKKDIFSAFENATDPMVGGEIRRLKLNPVAFYCVSRMVWLPGNIKCCVFSEGKKNPYHEDTYHSIVMAHFF